MFNLTEYIYFPYIYDTSRQQKLKDKKLLMPRYAPAGEMWGFILTRLVNCCGRNAIWPVGENMKILLSG